MSENSIIQFITFVGVVTLMQFKKHFHWLYLQDTDPTFRKYGSEDDYLRAKGLDGNFVNQPHQFSLSMELLIPFFKKDKDDKPSEVGKLYIKRIYQLLIMIYAGLIVLFAELILLE